MAKNKKRQKKNRKQQRFDYESLDGMSLKEKCDYVYPYIADNEPAYKEHMTDFIYEQIGTAYASFLRILAEATPKAVVALYQTMWNEKMITKKDVSEAKVLAISTDCERNTALSCGMVIATAFRRSGYSRYYPLAATFYAKAFRLDRLKEIADRYAEACRDGENVFDDSVIDNCKSNVLVLLAWGCRAILPEKLAEVVLQTTESLINKITSTAWGNPVPEYNAMLKKAKAVIEKRTGKTEKQWKEHIMCGSCENDTAKRILSTAIVIEGGQRNVLSSDAFRAAYYSAVCAVAEVAEGVHEERVLDAVKSGQLSSVNPGSYSSSDIVCRLSRVKVNEADEYLKEIDVSDFEAVLASACFQEAFAFAAQRVMRKRLIEIGEASSQSHDILSENLRSLQRKNRELEKNVRETKNNAARYAKHCAEYQEEIKRLKNIISGEEKSSKEKELERTVQNQKAEIRKNEKIIRNDEKEMGSLKEKNAALEEQNRIMKENIKGIKGNDDAICIADVNGHYFFAVEQESLESKLRTWFSNSLFSETSELSRVNAKGIEAVVVMTSAISHSESIRIEKKAERMNIPVIYCNGRNFERTLKDISEGLQRGKV